ncbi:protein phosphatase type 1 complex subunit Hex2/Reg1 [Xylariomycetidae sp. FL0641]|nr:protein phosphatase type 1 complex subunit Hex2/Reg1 [Xylariomycetidae sp. FL0641]
MAVVLTSEDGGLFSSSALRRSHSQPKFVPSSSQTFRSSASTSRISDLFDHEYRHEPFDIEPASSPSSAPSSPQTIHAESADPSYSSTPATNLSLDGQYEDDMSCQAEDLGFSKPTIYAPEFDENPYFIHLEDPEPHPSPQTESSFTASTDENEISSPTSHPGSPCFGEHAEDDTALARRPTQHVDYLSHNWKEEDIWSSWRYVVSRRGEFSNGPRLENASWRTWMKAKYRLRTVSPEKLNWLKDCDVTWLYGPLQTRQDRLFPSDTAQGSSTLSRSDSFVSKKPILKKRSMSEIMLQRSLSSSSLLKQATAVVQAQQKDGIVPASRPILHRAHTDCITFPFSARRRSRANTSVLPSATTSGLATPSAERKHIHFDEQVQQCIAVDVKGDEDEEDEMDRCRWYDDDDSDSDDGAIMMKKTATSKRPILPRRRSPSTPTGESKTIAMLPSTTLKNRDDWAESPETAMKHSTGSPVLSPSSSQETLRPSRPSATFPGGDTSESGEDGMYSGLHTSPCPVTTGSHSRQGSMSSGIAAEPAGMRRTESGMFMPYEEGDVQPNDGIIGRVIDTVNTARDIAHVIWNVGWRR